MNPLFAGVEAGMNCETFAAGLVLMTLSESSVIISVSG
jgi:hypothetical protein